MALWRVPQKVSISVSSAHIAGEHGSVERVTESQCQLTWLVTEHGSVESVTESQCQLTWLVIEHGSVGSATAVQSVSCTTDTAQRPVSVMQRHHVTSCQSHLPLTALADVAGEHGSVESVTESQCQLAQLKDL